MCVTLVQKHSKNSHLINHCPTSEGVSEVSERAGKWVQRSAQAKRVVQSKLMSEQSVEMSKWTSEWPSTYIPILCCSAPLWNGGRGKRGRGHNEESSKSLRTDIRSSSDHSSLAFSVLYLFFERHLLYVGYILRLRRHQNGISHTGDRQKRVTARKQSSANDLW